MANPSRTEWPDWVARPVFCCFCEKRVTLKQAHRTLWDERTRKGRVWHTACDQSRVALHVTRPS